MPAARTGALPTFGRHLIFGPAATDPATGAPATPDAPFHEWAAESMPENVEVGVNLLDKSS